MADNTIPFRKYFDNGAPKILGYHSKSTGRKAGKWEIFDNKGCLREVGFFDNDKKTGKWSYYNRYGRLRSTGYYEQNKHNGKWHFYINGNLDSVGTYKDGKPHGEWQYFQNGSLSTIGVFDKGQQSGEWKWFHTNSNVKEVIPYVQNQKHGEAFTYGTDGSLIRTETFNNGLKLSLIHI